MGASSSNVRPQLALYGVALLLANLNVFEIPLEHGWVVAIAIALGAIATQALVARRQRRSPAADGGRRRPRRVIPTARLRPATERHSSLPGIERARTATACGGLPPSRSRCALSPA